MAALDSFPDCFSWCCRDGPLFQLPERCPVSMAMVLSLSVDSGPLWIALAVAPVDCPCCSRFSEAQSWKQSCYQCIWLLFLSLLMLYFHPDTNRHARCNDGHLLCYLQPRLLCLNLAQSRIHFLNKETISRSKEIKI